MLGLIWDIQEEHLDEAEFLLEMWTQCVDSPKFTLASLSQGPEQRLLARVDGLLVGGDRVVEGLLLPVLDEPDDDEWRTAAATLTILRGASVDACARVLAAFDEAEDEGLRGLVRGLVHAQRPGLIAWLAHGLERGKGPSVAGRLRVLAGHRVDLGARLSAYLGAADLDVRRAAAVLARHCSAPEVVAALRPSLDADDPSLRWAAIESAMIRALPGAWALVCREAFAASVPRRRAALAWVAMLGDEAAHRRLLAELAANPTPELAWAAGLSGRPRAVDLAIELLEHPTLARLAGEIVSAVAGLPTTDDRFWTDRGLAARGDDELPDLDDDDLDADLRPDGDDALRLPEPAEVRFWWAQHRPALASELRHLAGRPLDATRLIAGLYELPTRRRHPLALELAARTGGRAQLSTAALSSVQHVQLRELRASLDELDLQRGLSLPG